MNFEFEHLLEEIKRNTWPFETKIEALKAAIQCATAFHERIKKFQDRALDLITELTKDEKLKNN